MRGGKPGGAVEGDRWDVMTVTGESGPTRAQPKHPSEHPVAGRKFVTSNNYSVGILEQ